MMTMESQRRKERKMGVRIRCLKDVITVSILPTLLCFFDVLSLKSESGHCTASLATLLDIAFVSESLELVETKTDLTRRCKERNLREYFPVAEIL